MMEGKNGIYEHMHHSDFVRLCKNIFNCNSIPQIHNIKKPSLMFLPSGFC